MGGGGGGGERGRRDRQTDRQTETERDRERKRELTKQTLFFNGDDISIKANSHICHCYSTISNQDIHSEILR